MVDNLDYPVQLIQPNGARVCRPEFDRLITDIGPDELLSLYRDLVVSRRIDTEAVALQRQGEIGLWAPMLGQEAAQVGSARALAPGDFAFTSYREHAVAYCRGVPPELLTTMWRGISHSGWDPEQFSVTNPAIVVGSQGLHATGYALGAHLDGAEIATIAYFGDGATSQGDIAEAMGFAASFRVGVVFFCQNNQWAISEPVSLQSRTPISHRAIGYGIPAIRVDGNDVLAVLAVTRSALNRAREGSGPTFIEANHLPDGPAHDLRRSEQVPHRYGYVGVEKPRSARANASAPRPSRSSRRKRTQHHRGSRRRRRRWTATRNHRARRSAPVSALRSRLRRGTPTDRR